MLFRSRERLDFLFLCILSIMGIAKAAVLPVPVWAIAITSSPFMMEGMALYWISVGRLNPSPARFFFIGSDMWYDSNFMEFICPLMV